MVFHACLFACLRAAAAAVYSVNWHSLNFAAVMTNEIGKLVDTTNIFLAAKNKFRAEQGWVLWGGGFCWA
jgi:hypothetical protein